jgi:hypothetical protein
LDDRLVLLSLGVLIEPVQYSLGGAQSPKAAATASDSAPCYPLGSHAA